MEIFITTNLMERSLIMALLRSCTMKVDINIVHGFPSKVKTIPK